MSPIGRVFIVLNLVLAGGFLAFSGTHLQKQHHFKVRYETERDGRAEDVKRMTAEKEALEKERNTFENAKTSAQTQLEAAQVANAKLADDNKRLAQQNSSFEGDIKALQATAEATKTEMKVAFEKANNAYEMALADKKIKDESVTAKDAALAENRNLKNNITELNETIGKRDVEIAGLKKDKGELGMLVKVAETNGFLRSMAAPNLAGLVTTSNGRLATIQVTDNPGNVNVAQAIETGTVSFAIYDASGYKGEVIAERYEESANAIFGKVKVVKGEVKQGDRASTKVN